MINGHDVPNGKLIHYRGQVDLDNEKEAKEFYTKYINGHWYNQKVQLILPIKDSVKTNTKSSGSLLSQGFMSSKLEIEQEILPLFDSDDSSDQQQCFYEIETTIDLLLSSAFIKSFIKPGGFHALSQLSYIDSGNVVAFLPDATVVLNVDKDTYQQLGIVGKASTFKNNDRYVIRFTMKDLTPASKSHNRILSLLTNRVSSVRMIAFLERDNKLVPIQFPSGVKVVKRMNSISSEMKFYRVPDGKLINEYLEPTTVDQKQQQQQDVDKKQIIKEFILEWTELIGLVSNDLNIHPDNDVDIGNYLLSNSKSTECFIGSFTGFISNLVIINLIEKLNKLIKSGTIEWGCLNIFGFSDTPISWRSFEHGYLYGGENDQSLLFLKDNQFLSSNIVGSLDHYC
ncbi:hypothetical protein CYY_005057 [Polysphondylium violaceum]|uniref:Uncharacterized protein n=1 Tax=Polysphondylium violaceum TaxID=133409 RepID=A0A8J4PSD7_9MYCE|nr:hypothetical protein CYY_005057 [Polysphondylium violaceum]